MRVTPRTIGVVAGALVLVGVGITVAIARRGAPSAPSPSASPSAVVDTREHCDTIARRYRRALAGQQACQVDEDCMAEARGWYFAGLDRCARFRRRDATPASMAEADGLATAWLDRGCSSTVLTCREERAQCRQGVCAERPPEPLAPSYRRVWCHDSFSFFLPADMVAEKVAGEDSIVGAFAGPKMRLSYDYGQFSNPLESENEDGGPPMDRILSRKEVVVSGTPAVLVTMEVLLMRPTPFFRSGVHFPRVAVSEPSLSLGGRADAKLTMEATCDVLADCEPAEGIFRSIELH